MTDNRSSAIMNSSWQSTQELGFQFQRRLFLKREVYDISTIGGSNLKSRVLQEIRDAITEGRLSPGERSWSGSCRGFRTSLTTVREALIHLELEGFITKVANTKSFVTQFSREQTRRCFRSGMA